MKKIPKKLDNEPKTVWANSVGTQGLLSDRPILCRRDEALDEHWGGNQGWYHEGPEIFEKIGKKVHVDGRVDFVSKNRKAVAIWTDGAASVMSVIKRFSSRC